MLGVYFISLTSSTCPLAGRFSRSFTKKRDYRYESELARPADELWAECYESFNLTRFYLSKVVAADDLMREQLQ